MRRRQTVYPPRGAAGEGIGPACVDRAQARRSAANQVAWLASIGVEVDFVGRVGAADVRSETYLRRRDRRDDEAELAAVFSEAELMRRGRVANSDADFNQRLIRVARR